MIVAGRNATPGAPLNVPLVPASNFVLGGEVGYARDGGTPTWAAFEEVMGGLEGGQAVAFASGMAVAAAVLDLIPVGGSVAIPDDCYQGVASLVGAGERQGRWSVRRHAVADTAAWIEAAATTDLLWIESPSNPLLVVADVPAICSATSNLPAVVAVDNTFATPLNQRPLEVGADIVVHSATKFIGGHSDLLCGVAVAADREIGEALVSTRALGGATPGTLETFLALRGVRTLALRLERAQDNAGALAVRLRSSPHVEVVRYPGLPDHPTHDTAARVLDGFGAVITFDVAGGAARADAVCRRLGLIRHATSLGGVESTIERRSVIPGQEHLPGGLLRLSVGCEDVDDLGRDLEAALAATV